MAVLVSLYIENFGLVERQEIQFGAGLNVLSGETGAGKSIVVEALRVSLGGRCRPGLIRTGRDRALVQSAFAVDGLAAVADKMSEYGLTDDGEGLLVMSRELYARGRSICRVNGRMVNLSVFRDLAGLLVDMHGQHDQQSLLLPARQLQLLDRYGGSQLTDLVQETGAAWRQWCSAAARQRETSADSRERQQRMDMLEFQIKEIDAASLEGEDEDELRQRRDMLANAERIGQLADAVLHNIHRGGHCPAAVDLLGEAVRELEEFSRYLPESGTCVENLRSALCLVEEVAREVSAYRQGVEANPQELNYLEERLDLVEKLKRKYASTLQGVLEYRRQAAEELEELRLVESDTEGLAQRVREKEQAYRALAARVSALRNQTARGLEEEARRYLQQLAMPGVKFAVQVAPGEPSATGMDRVCFQFSSNPGEPLRPLTETASGGELSRVMLALRSILAAADDTGTLVFDEIDAGIGGRTIHAVAELLEQLGGRMQIICITHAAAVAAVAANHYLVKKSTNHEHTVTGVEPLHGEARIRELNRMLGGDEESELLADYVRKMIK